jgi:hypothetical protein
VSAYLTANSVCIFYKDQSDCAVSRFAARITKYMERFQRPRKWYCDRRALNNQILQQRYWKGTNMQLLSMQPSAVFVTLFPWEWKLVFVPNPLRMCEQELGFFTAHIFQRIRGTNVNRDSTLWLLARMSVCCNEHGVVKFLHSFTPPSC